MWYRYICVFILFFAPLVSGAQLGNFQSLDGASQEPVINLNPSFPAPGEPFEATVEDFSGGVFGSQITWSYNGKAVPDGVNKRSVTLNAGAAGTNFELVATLISPDGAQTNVATVVSPIYIDIIIEAQTRIPEWYIGRALPSHTSQVNATALLHDGTDFLDSNQIVYSWRVNRDPVEGGAIRGGNKVSFETPRGNTPVLVVTASDLRGRTIANRAVEMTSVTPDIEYYEKHTLYGLSQLAVKSSASIIGSVLTLQAEPFNLDTRVYNNPDISQWEINRVDTDNGTANPYEITLSRAGAGGRTLVNFHVRSLTNILQGAEKQVQVNF